VSFCALVCSTWMLLSEVTPITWVLAILEALTIISWKEKSDARSLC